MKFPNPFEAFTIREGNQNQMTHQIMKKKT